MEIPEETFGNPGAIKEYTYLKNIGIILIISGGILYFLNNIFLLDLISLVVSIVFLFIGFMCFISGLLGLREEKKKFGIKILSTSEGNLALVFGIISVFLAKNSFFGIILGTIAIILGAKSVKKGDNRYGSTGIICGIIGIVLNIYIIILFNIFI